MGFGLPVGCAFMQPGQSLISLANLLPLDAFLVQDRAIDDPSINFWPGPVVWLHLS